MATALLSRNDRRRKSINASSSTPIVHRMRVTALPYPRLTYAENDGCRLDVPEHEAMFFLYYLAKDSERRQGLDGRVLHEEAGVELQWIRLADVLNVPVSRTLTNSQDEPSQGDLLCQA